MTDKIELIQALGLFSQYENDFQQNAEKLSLNVVSAPSNTDFPGSLFQHLEQELNPIINVVDSLISSRYLYAGALGFFNGALVKALATYLKSVEFLQVNQKTAEDIALVSAAVLRIYQQNVLVSISSCLILLDLFASYNRSNEKIQEAKKYAKFTGLVVYLYWMYNDEAALLKMLYMGVVITANLSGSVVGPEIGAKTSALTNGLYGCVSSCFNAGSKVASSMMGYASSFFGAYSPVETSNNSETTLTPSLT
ncbi:MAG: hypothetical protein EPN84_01580 [Legionella sp.]|nr:MAG: hypothetical protein EPN84_01580 [Legionella sp.]